MKTKLIALGATLMFSAASFANLAPSPEAGMVSLTYKGASSAEEAIANAKSEIEVLKTSPKYQQVLDLRIYDVDYVFNSVEIKDAQYSVVQTDAGYDGKAIVTFNYLAHRNR